MSDPSIAAALELLTRIATGEPGARGELVDGAEHEEVNALIVGLNMLAEDLEHEREQRRRAESLLQDERDSYDRSPALFCSVDAATLTILKCNQTLANTLARPIDELIGTDVVSLFVASDREAAARVFDAAVDGSAAVVPELALQGDPGGIVVHTQLSFVEGPVPRVRVVWRDVTRERLLERQLAQAQKMQAIGRLSGGVAHDFNNILSIVVASTSLARSQLPKGHPVSEDLHLIEEAAQRGSDLTQQLLAFSRQKVVRLQPVSLCEMVTDLDRLLRRLLPSSIDLQVELPAEDVIAVADSSQLSQVLVNLVVNARDAIEESGRILIEVESVSLDEEYSDTHLEVEPGDYALVTVTDDGCGMSSDVLSQVFEPFFTTKEAGKGSGLGLSMCYGIVRQSGGNIYVYSEVGHGTTIKVYLPRHGGAPTEPVAKEHSSLPPRGNETVLLVEDDDLLRKLGVRVLGAAGYRVIAAENGQDALATLAAEPTSIDLVVTDVVMPEMGGRDLIERLRVDQPDLPVLYVSGYTANAIVHEGVLEDGVEFLGKPYTPQQLLRMIRQVLSKA